MLTKKQRYFFDILKRKVLKDNYFPSIRELAREVGLCSTNSVWKYLKALEEKGYIVKKGRSWELAPERKFYSIPLCGLVPAGAPLEIFEELGEEIELPPWFLSNGDEKVIALRVKGLSMKDAYINDGDIVVIKLTETAYDGDFVVAMLEDGEITLKRLKMEKNGFLLVPENADFSPIRVKNLRIVGKVIGILRKYETI